MTLSELRVNTFLQCRVRAAEIKINRIGKWAMRVFSHPPPHTCAAPPSTKKVHTGNESGIVGRKADLALAISLAEQAV